MRRDHSHAAIVLGRICDGKRLELEKFRKTRPQTWLDDFHEQIAVLEQAVHDYETAAARQEQQA